METLQEIAHKVELCFHLRGQRLAVDHGFALYSAVSRLIPEFHSDEASGLKLIRGRYCGDGMLDISPYSELVLRTPAAHITIYLKLAGKTLTILGQKLLVGIPNTRAILPAQKLFAPLVITRNGQDQCRFEQESARQLQQLGVVCKTQVIKRRTCEIHGKQVVGYAVAISELGAEESVLLQAQGIGGRRKMGAGFFEKWDEHGI